MTANMEKNGTTLFITVEGRLDTMSSPELEEQLEPELEGIENLEIDLENLVYISSAGLRVLLSLLKEMESRGEFKIKNVRPEVMDVLEVTGFIDILNIE